MAKQYRQPTMHTRATQSQRIPQPSAELAITPYLWQADRLLHRIHHKDYAGTQFNPGISGNARFSPIQDTDGRPIPTLYGGASFDCAAMETVFHDVPFAVGLKTIDKTRLEGQLYSTIAPDGDLRLADLTAISLRKLGIRRNELIDSEKDCYPDTRRWAEAIHQQCPEIQGLRWISRQDDQAEAVVLFGDRLGGTAMLQTMQSRSLLDDSDIYDQMLDLAERIGVLLFEN